MQLIDKVEKVLVEQGFSTTRAPWYGGYTAYLSTGFPPIDGRKAEIMYHELTESLNLLVSDREGVLIKRVPSLRLGEIEGDITPAIIKFLLDGLALSVRSA